MEREVIKVGMPKVICGGGTLATLQAEVDDAGERKTLKYTVNEKYGKYLTWERSDAFVVSLLYYAMIKDRDLEWETPCNERLIYQLETYFVPAYAREMAFMHEIKLSGPTTTEQLPGEHGVATGISNGVDSSYTIWKHLEHPYKEYRLTHVLFTDWYLTEYTKDFKEQYIENYMHVLPECAEELGLGLIYVSMNLDELFSIGHLQDKECGLIQDAGLYTLKYCSTAMALQKLLHVYYFSSGYSASDFSLHKPDMSYHDIFTLPLISTESLAFYSVGMEVSRPEKVEAIANWPYAQKHLQVCQLSAADNCGRCSKCVRTMGELYAAGKLDKFTDVFPVQEYKDNVSKRLASVVALAWGGHAFERDIVAQIRKNGRSIPVSAYILAPYYVVREFFRTRLRTVKWARRLYRRLHLDKALYGRPTDAGSWVDKEAGAVR